MIKILLSLFLFFSSLSCVQYMSTDEGHSHVSIFRIARGAVYKIDHGDDVVMVGADVPDKVGFWKAGVKENIVEINFTCLMERTVELLSPGEESFKKKVLRLDEDFIEESFDVCRSHYAKKFEENPARTYIDIISAFVSLTIVYYCVGYLVNRKKRIEEQKKAAEAKKKIKD